jgi:3-hydroxybutyryl-CoA dehydrogenase
MKIEDIQHIAVIGAGNMGHQIAALCAIKGFKTVCMDTSQEMLAKAKKFFKGYIPSRVSKGKLTDEAAEQAKENLSFTTQLEEAVASADFVIEAIVEMVEVKRRVFAEMDTLAPPHAIFTTNSSYIVSSKITDATNRPEKVCNMHFFNPALVMKLVEVVKGPHVSDETARIAYALSERLGKKPIMVGKEAEGFVVNRIVQAIRHEAYWMLDMGIADAQDIDDACVYGLGHPLGPFRLNDLTGLDLTYTHAMEKFKRTGNPNDKPYPCLVKKYSQGHFGKKTGQGWHKYNQEG